MKTVQEIMLQQNAGKKQESQKKEYISMEKMITGGLQEKKDLADQIQKCFMIQESQLVVQIVNHHAIVENMWKYGITFSWSI